MLAVGFTAGPPADAVSALKPDVALQKALDQLDDMFRGRKWLKGGGCTGKGDWEERVGENVAQEEREHLERGQSEGFCPKIDSGDPEYEKRRDRGLKTEEQEHEATREEYMQHERATGAGGAGVGGAQDEGGAAELPSTAYTGGLVHDWVRDEPFVRGGYSYPRCGFDEKTHADAGASVNGSLFFAGEHTNTPTGMTVHAAIDSGERCGSIASTACIATLRSMSFNNAATLNGSNCRVFYVDLSTACPPRVWSVFGIGHRRSCGVRQLHW